jgi:hypothetical protein
LASAMTSNWAKIMASSLTTKMVLSLVKMMAMS